MTDADDVVDAIRRLAAERPSWVPVARAACAEARRAQPYGGRFAGSWVLKELGRESGRPAWRPGLRVLVNYGVLQKSSESTRGGRRSYYCMPEVDAVEKALRELTAQG
jgi:hypothetical protein